MPWNVIAQIGDDSYCPLLDPNEARFVAAIDKPDESRGISHNILSDVFKAGLRPTQTAIDLLNFAAIVYTADLRIWRGYNSEDAWTRDIAVYIPVTDPELWTTASPQIKEFLSFLTGDVWNLRFRARVAGSEPTIGTQPLIKPDAVCLFSGGLDSFVGAIDLLADSHHLALVGHYGQTQRELIAAFEAIRPKYNERMLPLWFYLVPPRASDEQIVESTMRARSILFLALGTCIASALDAGSALYVPENGLISLNVPLTYGRVGTHSTRTTHPHTIYLYRKVLQALEIDLDLKTPYRFMTKGEMLENCKDQDTLKSGIHSTMSCSHPQAGRFHKRPVGQHCGYCVPCIIRRASMYSVDLDDEPRNTDVLSSSIKANEAAGCDKRAFLMAISRLKSMSRLQLTSELMSAGPLEAAELDGLVSVYMRGMKEVENFLRQKR